MVEAPVGIHLDPAVQQDRTAETRLERMADPGPRGLEPSPFGADHDPLLAGAFHPDPEIHLDVVRGEPRAWEPGPVLSNSFGFGGHNGCLVLLPPEETARALSVS